MASGNLVPNGNFEMGLLGWRLAGEGDATLLWGPEEKDAATWAALLADLGRRGEKRGLAQPSPAGGAALAAHSRRPRHALHLDRSRLLRRPRPASDFVQSPPVVPGKDVAEGEISAKSAKLTTNWQQVTHSFTLPKDWTAASLCVRIDPPPTANFGSMTSASSPVKGKAPRRSAK